MKDKVNGQGFLLGILNANDKETETTDDDVLHMQTTLSNAEQKKVMHTQKITKMHQPEVLLYQK